MKKNSEINKPLILIDANNVCHIALHAMGDLSFHDKQTGVVFGFFVRLLKLWEEFGSNRFAFCWDSRKRFRSFLYPGYKANRSGKGSSLTDDERVAISKQMDELRLEILPAFGFKNSFHQTGFEADDLITEAVLKYQDEFIVVSTDKDLYQLLAIATCRFVYNTITGKKMSRDLFRKTYSIEPYDWIRVKVLTGDPSDNVLGIPGVGEKSAIAFVRGKLKGKRLDSIVTNQEIIDRNMRLMELPLFQKGWPIQLPDKLEPDSFSEDRLVDVFDRLGFQSFLRPDKLPKWKEFICG